MSVSPNNTCVAYSTTWYVRTRHEITNALLRATPQKIDIIIIIITLDGSGDTLCCLKKHR